MSRLLFYNVVEKVSPLWTSVLLVVLLNLKIHILNRNHKTTATGFLNANLFTYVCVCVWLFELFLFDYFAYTFECVMRRTWARNGLISISRGGSAWTTNHATNILFMHSFHHHFHFMFVYNLCLNKCMFFSSYLFIVWVAFFLLWLESSRYVRHTPAVASLIRCVGAKLLLLFCLCIFFFSIWFACYFCTLL